MMHGGDAFDINDRIAVLARPHPAHAPELPQQPGYCSTTGSRAPRARSSSAVLSEGALALPYSTR